MKIIDIEDRDSIQNAARVLKKGGILVFPTDTVYGIGCLNNLSAIKKLYKIKNRPISQPTAMLVNQSDLKYIVLPTEIKEQFYSGEMTLILETKFIKIKPHKFIIRDGKVGVRIPNLKWLNKLIKQTGPIVASSANIKGERTPKGFKDINKEIVEKVDLIITTQQILKGRSSRVYNLSENKYLR